MVSWIVALTAAVEHWTNYMAWRARCRKIMAIVMTIGPSVKRDQCQPDILAQHHAADDDDQHHMNATNATLRQWGQKWAPMRRTSSLSR